MWEHEFDANVKNDPREALYGGRCNSVKITHDINESKDKEIKYIDICSLHPLFVNTTLIQLDTPAVTVGMGQRCVLIALNHEAYIITNLSNYCARNIETGDLL